MVPLGFDASIALRTNLSMMSAEYGGLHHAAFASQSFVRASSSLVKYRFALLVPFRGSDIERDRLAAGCDGQPVAVIEQPLRRSSAAVVLGTGHCCSATARP